MGGKHDAINFNPRMAKRSLGRSNGIRWFLPIAIVLVFAIKTYVTNIVEPKQRRTTVELQNLRIEKVESITLSPSDTKTLISVNVRIRSQDRLCTLLTAIRTAQPAPANHFGDVWRCTIIIVGGKRWTGMLAGRDRDDAFLYIDGGLCLRLQNIRRFIEELAVNGSNEAKLSL
jgi:hypothetical protein